MTAIIVDDELKGRETLEYFLKEFFPHIEVIALCQDIKEAATVIHTYEPDIVFLDINMPKGSGFDLFHTSDLSKSLVVFVTAHAEHAVEAFTVNAFDYLLKPVSLAGLTRVMQKVKDHVLQSRNKEESSIIQLKTATAIRILNAIEINYVLSEGNYSTVYLCSGEKILISKNIKKMQETYFSAFPFVRINQSSLVNANMVKEYNSHHVLMKDETILKLTKNHADDFHLAMNKL